MLSPADRLAGIRPPSTEKSPLEVLSATLTGALSSLVIDSFCEALFPTSTLPKSMDAGLTASPVLLALEVVDEKALASDPQPASPPTMVNVKMARGRMAKARAAPLFQRMVSLEFSARLGWIDCLSLRIEELRNSHIGIT